MIRNLFIALTVCTSAFAQSGSNGVFSFLDRSVFAGASALGNSAYLHQGKVGAFAVQNPLLLTDSSLYQLELSSGSLGNGISLMQSSYGFRWKGRAFIAAAQTLQYGEFQATDTWGNGLGSFFAGDLAFSLGTSMCSWSGWDFGVQTKFVNGTYESYQSWAIATDWVAMKDLEEGPKIAFLVKNAGSQLSTFAGTREPMPLNVLIAVGDQLAHAPFRWTFVVDRLNEPLLGYDDPNLIVVDPVTGLESQGKQSYLNLALRHVNGSLEFLPTDRLHLMMGYSFRRQYEMALSDRRTSGGFSAGLGLYFDRFHLHFANELRSVAGRMNTLSLSLNL